MRLKFIYFQKTFYVILDLSKHTSSFFWIFISITIFSGSKIALIFTYYYNASKVSEFRVIFNEN